LKDKNTYQGFISFLQKLKIKELFVQLHDVKDNQMKNAYKNYDNKEFLEFISQHTGLKNHDFLGQENSRNIFKLY
jgi:hypothetical protein